MVEVQDSPSILLSGMAAAACPSSCPTAKAAPCSRGDAQDNARWPALRRQPRCHGDERYPFNPNGSPAGITGLTTPDGRFTIMMPHPERTFRTVQMSWHPADLGEDSPWLRMFRNARKWVG
jgi:phosphoribosylformylglycinamidine synthase